MCVEYNGSLSCLIGFVIAFYLRLFWQERTPYYTNEKSLSGRFVSLLHICVRHVSVCGKYVFPQVSASSQVYIFALIWHHMSSVCTCSLQEAPLTGISAVPISQTSPWQTADFHKSPWYERNNCSCRGDWRIIMAISPALQQLLEA